MYIHVYKVTYRFDGPGVYSSSYYITCLCYCLWNTCHYNKLFTYLLTYSFPKCRLQVYKSSLIPTVIGEWNSLPLHIREVNSLSTFINLITSDKDILNINKSPPSYFSFGDRFYNIIHTKLRHNCILNCDLFRYNIIESPSCTCEKVEDTYHYFFSCIKYARARDELFNNVFKIRNLNIVNTHVLLWGDVTVSDSVNETLFSMVHLFIKKSERFS